MWPNVDDPLPSECSLTFHKGISRVCFQKVLMFEHRFNISNWIPLEMKTLPDNFAHVDSLRLHNNIVEILHFPIIAY